VNGAGFVDPVKWNYYVETPVPLPAFVVRPPLPSVLAAIPLLLGGDVATISGAHAALLGVFAAGVVLLARRMMSLTASVLCALVLTLSPAALSLSRVPLADIPALLVLLLVLGSARGVVASKSAAGLCAIATIAGWATRPNLGAVGLAVVVVAIAELGPRRTLGSTPLRTYVGALFGGLAAIHFLVRSATGHAPYAGYGFMYETRLAMEAASYSHEYVGMATFLAGNAHTVLAQMRNNLVGLFEVLFLQPTFLRVGWIALPGIFYCVARDGRGRFERRLSALAAIGFTLIVVVTWGTFDRLRYPLPIVLCGALCGAALLDDLVASLLQRVPARSRQLAAFAAAGIALAALLPRALDVASARLAKGAEIVSAQARKQSIRKRDEGTVDPAVVDFCASLPPDAVVASGDPWSVHFACGNPAILLPLGLKGAPATRARFLETEAPRFILADLGRQARWVHRAGFRLVARNGDVSLYEVTDSRAKAPSWSAPPPLLCAGREPDCRVALGR